MTKASPPPPTVTENVVELRAGEYLSLPDSRQHCVAGPAKVKLRRDHRSTRVVAQILEGTTSPVERVIKLRYKRVGWGL